MHNLYRKFWSIKQKYFRRNKSKRLICSFSLSGNRNFEGINPDVKANYLASPPLVVAYALAGNMNFDLYKSYLGKDKNGEEVFLKIFGQVIKKLRI